MHLVSNIPPVLLLVMLLAAVHRWVLGPLVRRARSDAIAEPLPGAEPTVTVVVAMLNEGRAVARTIRSVMALDYPMHRLELVVVDDGSTDGSHELAVGTAAAYPNAHVLRNREHMGWRWSFDRAVRRSAAEHVLALEPGDELDPAALRHLVRRAGPDVTAVDGRVLAVSGSTWVAPLETARWFLEDAFLRSLEDVFGSVACLGGRATLYRREDLLGAGPALLARWVSAAIPAARGHADRRAPLWQLVNRGHRAVTALDALCFSSRRRAGVRACFARPVRRLRQGFAQLAGRHASARRLHPLAVAEHLVLVALLLAFPALLVRTALGGPVLELTAFGAGTLLLGVPAFAVWCRRLPRERRVQPLWLLPALVLMPLASILLAPLAAFTLPPGRRWRRRRARPPLGAGVSTAPERAG